VINETSAGNTLNFYGFGGPIDLSLRQTSSQTIYQGSAGSLALTLSNGSAFGTVIGTPYSDTLAGSDAAGQILVGGGSADNLTAGNGNGDFIQGGITQVVYLDFTETATPGNHVYTPT